jgi:hypothetical protein
MNEQSNNFTTAAIWTAKFKGIHFFTFTDVYSGVPGIVSDVGRGGYVSLH